MNIKDELIKFIKFNFVGIINTAVDFCVFWGLTQLGMLDIPAQIISYAAGIVNSFILNSVWTFRDRHITATKTVKFIIVNLASLGVSLLILTACSEWFGITGILAKVISLPFSLGINFLGNRLFVFNKKEVDSQEDCGK